MTVKILFKSGSSVDLECESFTYTSLLGQPVSIEITNPSKVAPIYLDFESIEAIFQV